jgi:hypothetical protein
MDRESVLISRNKKKKKDNDCYKYIMDLTTNGVVITDAIRFVEKSKQKLRMSKEELNLSCSDKEEFKEPN